MNIDWKRKLTSRKFWAAVALFISGVITAAGHKDEADVAYGLIMQMAAVVAYIIGEGLADSSPYDYPHAVVIDDEEEEEEDEEG